MQHSVLSRNLFPLCLAAAYVIFWTLLAINPYARDVWWAENIPLVIVFLLLMATFRRFRFSNWSYLFLALWLFWHTVGGHYTFERVPFQAITEFFGFSRNHFDRVGHFFIGFYAFPIAEIVTRKKSIRSPFITFLFALFAIMSLAAGYEIIEWWYAAADGGEAGASFLGSQGDIWDAQKDMLMDTLGALFTLSIFFLLPQSSAAKKE